MLGKSMDAAVSFIFMYNKIINSIIFHLFIIDLLYIYYIF